MARRSAPTVNAGSMADIAFLLLIFFLVSTTIETDYGISRKLPPPNQEPTDAVVRDRNLFQVELNQFDELLVEGEIMKVDGLKKAAIAFLDNGGGTGKLLCEYCKGNHDATSSDNPNAAIISLNNSRETSYEAYIAVQNELIGAYTTLRNREARRLYGVSFVEMEELLKETKGGKEREVLKKRIINIREMFPQKLSEANPVN